MCLYPGRLVRLPRAASRSEANVAWDASGRGELACLCVPSVRNGHLTGEMLDFLAAAAAAC